MGFYFLKVNSSPADKLKTKVVRYSLGNGLLFGNYGF